LTELTALRELKRGSQEALAWFIQKYGAYVSTIVTNIIQASMSPADVEEVTADVFFALWEQADQLKLSSVKSYLAGIARNKAKNKLRELGCTVPLNDDLILIDEISPEDMYARKEAAAIVRKTVEKMMNWDSPWPWYGQLMTKPQIFAYLLQIDFWLRHYGVEFCF